MKNKFNKIKNIAACAFVFFMISPMATMADSPAELYDNVWRLINTKYVDVSDNSQIWTRWRNKYQNKLETPEDAYVAIETMLTSLNDPYTRFLDPKEFAEETSSIKGSLKGIGVQIGLKDGNLVVIEPVVGSPADKAGLQNLTFEISSNLYRTRMFLPL